MRKKLRMVGTGLFLAAASLMVGCGHKDPAVTAAPSPAANAVAPPKVEYKQQPQRLPKLAGPDAGKKTSL